VIRHGHVAWLKSHTRTSPNRARALRTQGCNSVPLRPGPKRLLQVSRWRIVGSFDLEAGDGPTRIRRRAAAARRSAQGNNIATFAEVNVDRKAGDGKVVRVVSAFQCGAIVNPYNLRNQIEGSNIQGLGGALFEAIEFENGKIMNGRMSEYRGPRFSDVPVLETVLLDRKDLPSAGAGECPAVGLAPAIANAIFDASDVRLRSLPLVPKGLKMKLDPLQT
jgi:CO/xanthine dehydrogenase Mo-binding subunit